MSDSNEMNEGGYRNPEESEPMGGEKPAESSENCGVYAGVIIGWLLFGWIFGWHWAILGYYGGGKRAYMQMARTWLLVALFIAFRWPLPDWSEHCSDNSTMSRDCLFHDQDARYTGFYLTHIFILAFVFITYIAEVFSLVRWTSAVLRFESSDHMYFCCSTLPFTYTYILTFSITLCIVTIWANLDWKIG